MSNSPVTAEDLYLYAMELLDPAEQTRIHQVLPTSPETRADLATARGDLALLALVTEPQEVPPGSAAPDDAGGSRGSDSSRSGKCQRRTPAYQGRDEHRNEFCCDGSRRAAGCRSVTPRRPYVQEPEPRRGFFSLFVPWAGWAVAAGLAVSTFTYYQRATVLSDRVALANEDAARAAAIADRAQATSARAQAVLETLRSASSQRFVLTAATVKPVPSARVTYLAATGALVFQGSNMDPVPTDKTYELWLIPKGAGAKPIPAGTFKPDARGFASVVLSELPKGTVAAAFGITMEDKAGAKTPTLPILMVGTA